VRESEVLQTSSVSASALSFISGVKFAPEKTAGGASPAEREAFVNVRFHLGSRSAQAALGRYARFNQNRDLTATLKFHPHSI
jgi:hypothetical protein